MILLIIKDKRDHIGRPSEATAEVQRLPSEHDLIPCDARRDNSPVSGVITLSKSLLHIRQQNYKMKGGGNFSPALSLSLFGLISAFCLDAFKPLPADLKILR